MINFKKSKQYTLSIRLSTDGFCFAVHNPLADNEFAYMPYRVESHKTVAGNLKTAMEGTELLKHSYAAVNIVLPDVQYTIVPKEYYAEQCASDIYQQNYPQAGGSVEVLSNVVGEEQAVVLFAIEKDLYRLITQRYPKAQICASISALINYGVEKSYAQSSPYCLAHLRKQGTDLLCFSNGTPLFVNTFRGNNMADMQYFLLNCWQVLGLSQEDDTLHIAGTTRHGKTLMKELDRFIQNIHQIRPAEEFHSTELARIDGMPFDLQTLISCE